MTVPITEELAERVLELITKRQYGEPEDNGKLWLEESVRYALSKTESDCACVAAALNNFTGMLDANFIRSCSQAEAPGLCRLAVVQLGTAGTLDEALFIERLTAVARNKWLPQVVRKIAPIICQPHNTNILEAAKQCEKDGGPDSVQKLIIDATKAADAHRVVALLPGANPGWKVATLAAETVVLAAKQVTAAKNGAGALACQNALAASRLGLAANLLASIAVKEANGIDADEITQDVVQILTEMATPGSRFLYLAD